MSLSKISNSDYRESGSENSEITPVGNKSDF